MEKNNGGEDMALSADAMSALQDFLGENGGDGDELAAMLMFRRQNDSDSDSDDDEEEEEEGEKIDHAAYYRERFPERYGLEAAATAASGEQTTVSQPSRREDPVALVTLEDDYVQDLLLSAFESRPHWRVSTAVPDEDAGPDAEVPFDLHWGEYEHLQWFGKQFSSGRSLVSCYYNRKGLIRKGHLAYILEKWRAKHTDRLPLAPKSYILTLDAEASGEDPLEAIVQRAVEKSGFPGFEGKPWILKPSVTNQANGIAVIDSGDGLNTVMEKADEMQRAGDFVLQDYLPPLLLDRRKFHLRVFMLLNGNLTAYVSPEFLAIFSLEPYENAPLEHTRAHLTNIAHQEVLSEDDQHRCMRLFEETIPDMVACGAVKDEEEGKARFEAVRKRVFDMCAELVEAVSSELTFQPRANCFELFGLDFMIDPDWHVWLLEANAEPDLSKAGDRLQPVIDGILRDTLSIVVDRDPRFAVVDAEPAPVKLHKVFERAPRPF
ncbi:Tubulin glycylase 3C [Hondaea fermentalgiana]|uniref:Tubulin glycylase 3C n=1 Tax=Hondaea fermentalgiana TaxID=2315210 RepID=A0A2R5GBC5_9STRA|nr:Tubulin glycylase 3C [Hondaea fermentalgiana]|eukprot:GBG25411.1 Tubulin glycylase 3C [Hondaea fermentalgiana]